jgi:transposase-like protein
LEINSHSISELESIYNVNRESISDWLYKYEKYGVEGLKETSTWRNYSKELKLTAVKDYLSGEYSLLEVSRKYEDGGEEGLKDKRGRKKEEAELTPEEKIQLQMKKLERENERLRAENLFLKKLEEIERMRK